MWPKKQSAKSSVDEEGVILGTMQLAVIGSASSSEPTLRGLVGYWTYIVMQ